MAKIYRLDDRASPPPKSEQLVLQSFERLPDDWHIFHSVRWQSIRNGKQGDGEADFIVANRQRGLLVLEVKGGDVKIEAGRWVSTDARGRNHEIRNPYAQASDSKYALLGFLDGLLPSLKQVRIGHAVVFPSIDINFALATYAQRDATLCATDLLTPIEALERVCAHWTLDRPFSQLDLERIVCLLAPTVEVKKTLQVDLARSEAEIVRLTDEQQDVFRNLNGVRRLIVSGGPGTGKTLLALEQARRLAAQGLRTKLVCYNDLLSRELSNAIKSDPHIDASTFHAWCIRMLRQSGVVVPATPTQGWWDHDAPTLLNETRTASNFDALIVDEGQDFSPSWVAALIGSLTDPSNGPVYIFADDRQELWRRDWKMGLPFAATYHLHKNCRNTLPISKVVAALYDESMPSIGAAGASPALFEFRAGDDVISIALELAERLLDQEGLSPNQLVLICDDIALVRRLREAYLAAIPITPYAGGGVVCESIGRFKGLEAPAVLLMLTGRVQHADLVASAYVGMSRARSAAVVLATAGHPIVKAFDVARQRK